MRPARAPGARRGAGVSLLELLVVVAVIGVSAALSVAAIGGGTKGMQLRGAAREVAAQLRYTRMRAIATGQAQRFSIDPRSGEWTAPDGRNGRVAPALRIAFTGARQAQARRDMGAIVFFHDGASTGGRVRLSRESAHWDVDVRWLTGDVRVARATP